MAEHIIIEPILGKNISLEVSVIVQPVIGKLFGTQYQNGAVAQFVVFNDRKSGEGFAESDAVSQNAAIVGFELVDNTGCCISLEIEKLFPYQRFLITCKVVRQNIFINTLKELAENVVEHQKIDALWRVILIDGSNMIANNSRYIFKLFRIFPNLFKKL